MLPLHQSAENHDEVADSGSFKRLLNQPLLRVPSLLIRIAAYKRSVNVISLTLSGVTSTISLLIRASTKFFVLELAESGAILPYGLHGS